jgi:hypothetical protein
MMAHTIEESHDDEDLRHGMTELRDAVGLEEHESTSHNENAGTRR